MPGFMSLFSNFFLGKILSWEVTERAVGIFGSVVIFPWFIVFVVGSTEETLELVLT
jgi:hypothetical protein